MTHPSPFQSRILCTVLVLLIGGMTAFSAAQAVEEPPLRTPDVPYVPTPQPVVEKMLDMAQVKEGEVVYDLGCGDGRIVITAAKARGARGVGVDINPRRIEESKANAREAGVEDKVEFRVEDLFEMKDLNQADVVTLYLLPSVNLKLRPKLLEELDPGKRVVSHAFDMHDWEADEQAIVEGKQVYLWIIPARVEGAWTTQGQANTSVNLKQSFQKLSGTVELDGTTYTLEEGRVRGKEIEFNAASGDAQITFTGKLEEDRLTGQLTHDGQKTDLTLIRQPS